MISIKRYEQIAREDPDAQWELARGVPRKKPAITIQHGDLIGRLSRRLMRQLDEVEYSAMVNHSRLRHA